MNRPYVYRGRKIPGIYQRCNAKCCRDRCDRHRWQYEIELPPGPDGTPAARRQGRLRHRA